ncbi:MAG: regulatory protein RecX [Smithellaceae bacterium]
MKKLDLAAAKQKAYRLLSMRPHSERELEKKLRDKGFPAAVVQEALEKLHDLKYLNDASFAIQWARNLAINKLWGNRKIAISLQEKGIPPRLIDDAIATARQEMTQEEAIAILVKKRTAKSSKAAFEIKDKQRIFQSLMGRGFPPGLILNQLGSKAEDQFNGENG